MSSGLGIRTIWISLRATNYTAQAFSALQKAITTLQDAEADLAKKNKAITETALQFFNAGLMVTTLGTSLVGALWSLATSSRQGAGDFARLNQQMFLTKQAFANTMYEILKGAHVFEYLNSILRWFSENKWAQVLVISLVAIGAGLAIIAGVGMIASAAIAALTGSLGIFTLISTNASMALVLLKTGFSGLTWNAQALGTALGMAFGSFMLFFTIASQFHGTARYIVAGIMLIVGALVALIAAQAGASMGLTLIGAGAAIAGAGAIAGELTGSFPIGTRSVSKDGIGRLHKGEIIYNPNTNLPTSVGNDLSGNGKPSVTTNYITMPISNLNTKSDVDDVDDYMSASWRKALRSVR